MKVTEYKTQAEQNAAWYGKKPVKGIGSREPLPTSKTDLATEIVCVLSVIAFIGLIIALVGGID